MASTIGVRTPQTKSQALTRNQRIREIFHPFAVWLTSAWKALFSAIVAKLYGQIA